MHYQFLSYLIHYRRAPTLQPLATLSLHLNFHILSLILWTSLSVFKTPRNEYFYSLLLSVSIKISAEFEIVFIKFFNIFLLPPLPTVTYSFLFLNYDY